MGRFSLIGEALAQTGATALVAEPWYYDVRWWGIFVSGGIGLVSLVWGRIDKATETKRRREDEEKRQKERKEDFDRNEHLRKVEKLTIPLLAAMETINSLIEKTDLVMREDISDIRTKQIEEIQVKAFPHAFAVLGMRTKVIDEELRRLGMEHGLSRFVGDKLGDLQSRLDTLIRSNESDSPKTRQAIEAISMIYADIQSKVDAASDSLRTWTHPDNKPLANNRPAQ